jgi:hypothetical protein
MNKSVLVAAAYLMSPLGSSAQVAPPPDSLATPGAAETESTPNTSIHSSSSRCSAPSAGYPLGRTL